MRRLPREVNTIDNDSDDTVDDESEDSATISLVDNIPIENLSNQVSDVSERR